MEIKYIWARSLITFLEENYEKLIKENNISEAEITENGEVFLDDVKVDLNNFEFKHIIARNKKSESVLLGYADDLIKYEDACAENLAALFGWGIQEKVIIDKGNVDYKDFLPLRGSTDWKIGSVPRKVISYIRSIQSELNCLCEDEDFSLFGFEYFPLLRLYMSEKGLTLGVWDSQFGSDDYYGDLYYCEMNSYSYDLEEAIFGIVAEVMRLGKPVRDVFILTEGSCDKMYYRKNDDGEYTITIY